jgi:uncharacterized membrane protein YqiK
METTMLTIIMVTALITVAIIGLGLGIWAIVRLTRRVSALEVLCADHRKELDNVYREFEMVGINHENKIKGLYDTLYHHVNENERNLDKRFDKVYRKINETSPDSVIEG